MLTLRSRMKRNGFSIMDVDELYFINGGCGPTGGSPQPQPNYIPEPEKKNEVEKGIDSINKNLPSGIEIKDGGLSFPFFDGNVTFKPTNGGVSVDFSFKF